MMRWLDMCSKSHNNLVIDYELFNPKTGTTIKGTTGVDSEVIHGEPQTITDDYELKVEVQIL